MEPVEINAGAWYLRAVRADEWLADTSYAWVVCEPTTGGVVAEVTLNPGRSILSSRPVAGGDDVAARLACTEASEAVRRFAATLDLAQPVTQSRQRFSEQPGDVHL